MFVFIFVCIALIGAVGCALIGLGHERGNGLLITIGIGLLFIAIMAITLHS